MEKKLFLRNIKNGFATNSSSYHSTLIILKSDYEKWVKGEIKIKNGYGEEITYDEWGMDFDTDYDEFTTPQGETIVILCKYGSN